MLAKSLLALAALAQATFTVAAVSEPTATATMLSNTPYFGVILPTGYQGFAIGGIAESDFTWVKDGTKLLVDNNFVDSSSFNVLADGDKIELVYSDAYSEGVFAQFEATPTADASTLVGTFLVMKTATPDDSTTLSATLTLTNDVPYFVVTLPADWHNFSVVGLIVDSGFTWDTDLLELEVDGNTIDKSLYEIRSESSALEIAYEGTYTDSAVASFGGATIEGTSTLIATFQARTSSANDAAGYATLSTTITFGSSSVTATSTSEASSVAPSSETSSTVSSIESTSTTETDSPSVTGVIENGLPYFVVDIPENWSPFAAEGVADSSFSWNNQSAELIADGQEIDRSSYTLGSDNSVIGIVYLSDYSTLAVASFEAVPTESASTLVGTFYVGSIDTTQIVKRDDIITTLTATLTLDVSTTESSAAPSSTATSESSTYPSSTTTTESSSSSESSSTAESSSSVVSSAVVSSSSAESSSIEPLSSESPSVTKSPSVSTTSLASSSESVYTNSEDEVTVSKTDTEFSTTTSTLTSCSDDACTKEHSEGEVIVSKTDTEFSTTTSTLTSCSDGACTKEHSEGEVTETATTTEGETVLETTSCSTSEGGEEEATVTETTSCSTSEGGDSGNATVTEDETVTETTSCSTSEGEKEATTTETTSYFTSEGGEVAETSTSEGPGESPASDDYTIVSITSTSYSTTTTSCEGGCEETPSESGSPEAEPSTYEGGAPHLAIGVSTFILGFVVLLF
ncbi:hypothetical protein B5S28_g3790 [[Candida] boidinii]|nr:hypothetical protein B5S28_g3790 [[Candida] boidinii]